MRALLALGVLLTVLAAGCGGAEDITQRFARAAIESHLAGDRAYDLEHVQCTGTPAPGSSNSRRPSRSAPYGGRPAAATGSTSSCPDRPARHLARSRSARKTRAAAPPDASRRRGEDDAVPSGGEGYPRPVPLSSGQRLLRFDRRLETRFVAGADEAGRGRSPARWSSPASSSTTRHCVTAGSGRSRGSTTRSRSTPTSASGFTTRSSGLGDTDRRPRDRVGGDRPRGAPPVELVGAPHRPLRAAPAGRVLPRRRLPARPPGAAARRGRRRRYEERGDRGRLGRREGHTRPPDAAHGRRVSPLRVLLARRLHHTGAHARGPRPRAVPAAPPVVREPRLRSAPSGNALQVPGAR